MFPASRKQIFMKILKIILIVLLGGIIVSVGNTIGGTVGNMVVIIGGIGAVYGIITILRKKKQI